MNQVVYLLPLECGGRGRGSSVVEGVGMGESAFPGLKCLTKIVTWFPCLGVY